MYTITMADNEKKPLNYWQKNPNEEPVQHAPEMPGLGNVTENTKDSKLTDEDPINWTAQEYIHLEKGGWWFFVFVLIVLGLIALDVLVLQSWTFSALVIVMAISIIVYSRRPPRSLHYALSPSQGLYVGEKLYKYDEFKSFGLIQDGDHHSIMLIPRKRFSPGVSVYFPEDAGERIVDTLGKRLPMENLKLDAIDVIARKLRL